MSVLTVVEHSRISVEMPLKQLGLRRICFGGKMCAFVFSAFLLSILCFDQNCWVNVGVPTKRRIGRSIKYPSCWTDLKENYVEFANKLY
jgi:hypothetical protein